MGEVLRGVLDGRGGGGGGTDGDEEGVGWGDGLGGGGRVERSRVRWEAREEARERVGEVDSR